MKRILSLIALACLPVTGGDTSTIIAPAVAESAAPAGESGTFCLDAGVGTLGASMSIGYHLTPALRLRLRGAMLSYSERDIWTDSQATLNIYGNSLGLMLDYFPMDGNKFYLTAGLHLSESKMRCRTRAYRERGMSTNVEIGGITYSITDGDYADISGKYSWNHAQPYIGIGYQDKLLDSNTFYYSLELGLAYMGDGKLRTSSTGNLRYQGERGQFKPATSAQYETSIRHEARDFFKIANHLHIYPILQLTLGAQF